ASLPEIDLLPGALPHVVDEELRPRDVGIEGHPERLQQPPGERLLASLPRIGHARQRAARRPCALERVGSGDTAGGCDPQDLAEEDVLVAGRIVLTPTPAVERVVTAT